MAINRDIKEPIGAWLFYIIGLLTWRTVKKVPYAIANAKRGLFAVFVVSTMAAMLGLMVSLVPLISQLPLESNERGTFSMSLAAAIVLFTIGAEGVMIIGPELIWPLSKDEKAKYNESVTRLNSKLPKWLQLSLYKID